jgi:hypothetical protein
MKDKFSKDLEVISKTYIYKLTVYCDTKTSQLLLPSLTGIILSSKQRQDFIVNHTNKRLEDFILISKTNDLNTGMNFYER